MFLLGTVYYISLLYFGVEPHNYLVVFFHEQRDTTGLNAENNELKLRLQTMEQQVHLQDGKDLSAIL